tara:strand:- start:35 stop:4828 length:4794 start_codon:yes stop_codon:yes gene_type:complete
MSFQAITKDEYLKNNPSVKNLFSSDESLANAVYTQGLKDKLYLEERYTYETFKEQFLKKEISEISRPLSMSNYPVIEEKSDDFLGYDTAEEIVQTIGSVAEKLDRSKDQTIKIGSSIKDFALSGLRTEEETKERKIEREARQELKEIKRFRKPEKGFNLTRSALTDVAYLANKFVGDKIKPTGDLSKIREFHKIAVKEGRYKGTWEEFSKDPKGITTKYGLTEAVIAIDSLPDEYKKDLINGILPENKTELSNFRIEGTRPTSKLGRLTSFAVGDIAPFIVGTTKLKAGADLFIRAPNWVKQADKFVETAKNSGKLSKRFLGVLAKGTLNFGRYAPSAELTAQVLLNPYEDRLSKIVGSMMAQDDGFADDVITFLSTDDSSSELEARLDMALEGAVTWVGLGAGLKASAVSAFSLLKGIKAGTEKTILFMGKTINSSYKGRAAEIRDSQGKLKPEAVEQFAILHNPSEAKTGNFLHSMMENIILPVFKSGGALSRQMTAVKETADQKMAQDSYGIEKAVKHLGEEIDNLIMVSKGLKIKDKKLDTSKKVWEHIGNIITKNYPKVKASKEASSAQAKKFNRETGEFEDSGLPLLKSLNFEKDLKELPEAVANSVRNIRMQIDSMSATVMNTKDGFISPEVKAIIEANLGKYLKTQYEFFISPYWKPTKTVQNNYVDYLTNNRYFREHVKDNIKNFKAVAGVKDVYRYTAQQYVDGMIKNKNAQRNMLNLNIFDEGASGAYRNIHKNLFSKKQKLSKEARAFYGEVTDPQQQIIATVRGLSKYIETDKMFKTFVELGEGVSLFKGAQKGRYNTRIGLKNTSSPTGTAENLVLPKLGALDDYYTTPKLAKVFRNIAGTRKNIFQSIVEDNAFGQIFVAPVVAFKAAANVNATVLSNTTQIRNFMAGPLFLLANGRVPNNLQEAKKSLGVLALTIANKSDAELEVFEKMLIKEGVINSSVVVSELKATMKAAGDGAWVGKARNFFKNDPTGNALLEGTKTTVRKTSTKASNVVGKAQEIYVGSDNFFKILYFQDQKRILKEAYKLDGKTILKTKKDRLDFDNKLNREAADIVKNTMPNYNKVAPFFKDFAYTPFGSFFSFRYEEIRTSINALGLGIRQMNSSNSVLRKAGEKRTAGVLGSMLVGVGGVTDLTTNAINGITDSERWSMEVLRKDYEKYSRTATVVDPDTGNLSLVNMTYLDPYSDISRLLVKVAIDAIDDKITVEEFNKKATDVVVENMFELIEPFIIPGIAPQAVSDAFIKGSTSSGKQILQDVNPDSPFPLFLQEGNKMAAFEYIFKTALVPKTYTNMTNLLSSYNDQTSGKEYKRNFANELVANLTGIKMQEFDLESNFKQATSTWVRADKNITSKFNNDLSVEEYTVDELAERVDKYNNDKYKIRTKIKETTTAARILGMDMVDIETTLKKLSISKRERQEYLYSNSFDPYYLLNNETERLVRNNPQFVNQVGRDEVFNYEVQAYVNDQIRDKYRGKKPLINFNINKLSEREELEALRPFETVPDWIYYIRNNTDKTSFKDGKIKEKLSDRKKLKEGGRIKLAEGTLEDPEDRNNMYAGESFFETTRPSLRAILEKRNEAINEQRQTN